MGLASAAYPFFLTFRHAPAWEQKEALKAEKQRIRASMAEKIFSGEIGSSWEAAKLSECVAFGVSRQSIEACLSSTYPLFVQPRRQEKLDIQKAAEERQTIEGEALESRLAGELLSRSRLSDERRRQAESAARTRERDAAATESLAALAKKQCELERLQNLVTALMERLHDQEVAKAGMELATTTPRPLWTRG